MTLTSTFFSLNFLFSDILMMKEEKEKKYLNLNFGPFSVSISYTHNNTVFMGHLSRMVLISIRIIKVRRFATSIWSAQHSRFGLNFNFLAVCEECWKWNFHESSQCNETFIFQFFLFSFGSIRRNFNCRQFGYGGRHHFDNLLRLGEMRVRALIFLSHTYTLKRLRWNFNNFTSLSICRR